MQQAEPNYLRQVNLETNSQPQVNLESSIQPQVNIDTNSLPHVNLETNGQPQVDVNIDEEPEAETEVTSDVKRVSGYSSTAAVVSGIIQIICGIVAVIVGIAIIQIKWQNFEILERRDRTGTGIWAGLFFVVTGIFGLASTTKRRALILGYLIMSILSTAAAVFGVYYTSTTVAFTSDSYTILLIYDSLHLINVSALQANQKCSVILILILVIDGIAAITAVAFACASELCCATPPSEIIQERVIYVASGSSMKVPTVYSVAPPAYASAPANQLPAKIPVPDM